MAFLNGQNGKLPASKGARALVVASVLTTGILIGQAAGAADVNDGAIISSEGLDLSASFVRFDGVDGESEGRNNLPAPPQDLSVLLAQVETTLSNGGAGGASLPAVPLSAAEIKLLVAEAQMMVAPIMAATGGGALPALADLSLDSLPLVGLGAGSGGLPVALPGLEGLDLSGLPGGAGLGGLGGGLPDPVGGPVGGLGDALGGAIGGAVGADGVGGVTGGLPALPVVGGILGQ